MLSTKPPCEFEPKLWLPRNHGFQLSLRLCFHEVRKRRVRRRGLFSVGIGFGILISKVQLLSTLKGCGFDSEVAIHHLSLILGGPVPTPEAIPQPIAQHCGTKQKAPGPRRGLMLNTAGFSLPAGLEAGSATRAAVRAAAKDVTARDQLDPK